MLNRVLKHICRTVINNSHAARHVMRTEDKVARTVLPSIQMEDNIDGKSRSSRTFYKLDYLVSPMGDKTISSQLVTVVVAPLLTVNSVG